MPEKTKENPKRKENEERPSGAGGGGIVDPGGSQSKRTRKSKKGSRGYPNGGVLVQRGRDRERSECNRSGMISSDGSAGGQKKAARAPSRHGAQKEETRGFW